MKILYLVSRVPYPINKGDKLRAYSQLKSLHKKHKVTLFAINDDYNISLVSDKVNDICNKLIVHNLTGLNILLNLLKSIFNPLPFQVSYFYSKKVKEKIDNQIIADKPDLIICQLIRMAEYVKDINNIPKIIDYVDAISFGLEKRIRNANIIMRWILRNEYKRVLEYEEELSRKFNGQIIITERDHNLINVYDKSILTIIPNGINEELNPIIGCDKEFDLLFVGNLEYPPNEDAALFLINEIFPVIKKIRPEVKLCIAGASPTKKVIRYKSKDIVVTGWVEDIREIYCKSKVFIAPMRLGSGLQNKLLQALSLGIPSVTSKLSFDGLYREANNIVLVAKEIDDYKDIILKLLDDDEYYSSISSLGKTFVKRFYSIDKVENDLLNFVNSVVN